MAFFFDMDNPAVSEDFEEDYDYSETNVEDKNELEVEIRNGFPDIELDIVLIHDGVDQVWKSIFDKVLPDETAIYYAYEGDVLRAFVAGTDTAVSDIEVKIGQSQYTFVASPQKEFISEEL